MRKAIITFTIMLLCLFGCTAKDAVVTNESSELVAALSDKSNETRAGAAASLRRLFTTDPNARTNYHGEEYWKQRVDSVKKGMKHSEVLELLPVYEQMISGEGSGDSHVLRWRLDHYWIVTVQYRNPDTVIERPKLESEAMHTWVKPPENFTGKWVTWYVNGHKSHEIEYKDGKYHGTFIAFYDNGQMRCRQYYNNGICSGTDTGWYPDGSVMYQGTYTNNKQTGIWIHWKPDGSVNTREQHDAGTHDSTN